MAFIPVYRDWAIQFGIFTWGSICLLRQDKFVPWSFWYCDKQWLHPTPSEVPARTT